MDLLSQCAQEFQKLLPYEYRFTIGRKGKLVTFSITFEETDFHHLAGLHKLRDNALFITGARNRIFRSVLAGHLTQANAQSSAFYNEIESRFEPLAHLENFLDSNELVFRYNESANVFSVIEADYLLENKYNGNPVYLFIARRDHANLYVCRSFFPKEEKDYTLGQTKYTMLKKEKIDLRTGISIVQYDRLTPRMP